ncbi:Protein ACCELERATED CELL DEATH 6 [Bienertia sinuspersici]
MSFPKCKSIGVAQEVSMKDTIKSLNSIYYNNLSPSRCADNSIKADSNDTDTDNSDDSSQSAKQDSGSSNVAADFTPIDATMYKLIVEGKLDDILKSQVSLENLKCKEHENSVLHIAASAGQCQLITELVPKSKGVIKETNNIGDLAFHTAAKAAQYDSLKALIKWDNYDPSENIGKSLLGEKNDEGDTTLHIVLENDDQQMAEMGLVLFDEFCQACYQLNNKKISPLYLRMITYTKQHKDTVEPILLQGKSVLHAAIEAKNTDILKLILDNHKELIKLVENEEEQSPLSYAAFKGHLEGVQCLLKNFPEHAYEYDKEGSLPIHKAACSGNVKVIQELHMTKNLLNKKGQSILHLAAKNGKSQLVSHLIRMPELKRLINLKDEDGNTPLHLATRGLHPRVVYILTREKRCNTKLQNKRGLTALDIFEVHVDSFPTFEARLTWMALRYVDAPRSSQSIRKSYYKQIDKVGKQNKKANSVKELDGFRKRVDTHMLVATLVATVTFAAGFTLPGGYNQSDKDPNVGMAVLPDKWAFKSFIICNTAALYSAILCVVTLIWAHLGDLKLILVSLKFALPLLGFALVMMSLAFMMGIFVVLRTVPWLSYVVLGMGCLFLFGVLLFFIPLYNP